MQSQINPLKCHYLQVPEYFIIDIPCLMMHIIRSPEQNGKARLATELAGGNTTIIQLPVKVLYHFFFFKQVFL